MSRKISGISFKRAETNRRKEGVANEEKISAVCVSYCGPERHVRARAQSQSRQAPVIQINVTRTIQAVNYMAKGSTRIDFRGTALLPQATGQAKVEAKNGAVLINANFDNLSRRRPIWRRLSDLRALGHHARRTRE